VRFTATIFSIASQRGRPNRGLMARGVSHTIGHGLVEKMGIVAHAITIAGNDTGVTKSGPQARIVHGGGRSSAAAGGSVAIDGTGREITLSTGLAGRRRTTTARGATRILRHNKMVSLLPVHENATNEEPQEYR
jgi:hypothetical protein